MISAKCEVIIFGARGYTGLELVKILATHRYVEKIVLVSNDSHWKVEQDLIGLHTLKRDSLAFSYLSREQFFSQVSFDKKVVFLACSAKDAFACASHVTNRGGQVIDLSGAHRLALTEAKQWYGLDFDSELQGDARCYGLVPFSKPSEGQGLISNPGCYVTSVLMALIPLLQANLVESEGIVIDAKSGTSGAGRTPNDLTVFSEMEGNMRPYKIGCHQHLPEIVRFAKYFGGQDIDPFFSTTLIPISRGILSSIYLKLRPGASAAEVSLAYARSFEGYPFVLVENIGDSGERGPDISLKRVIGTNFTLINFTTDGQKLTVFSMIDNLLKGASGQAIENFNLLKGYAITSALIS